MRLTKSQNNNVKNMCIVVNPVHMNSKQGGINPSWDRLNAALTVLIPPHHITCVW
jgi:hypothetical protein